VDDETFGHIWKENGKYWEERKEREKLAQKADESNVDKLNI
jgi:hypothetical protein